MSPSALCWTPTACGAVVQCLQQAVSGLHLVARAYVPTPRETVHSHVLRRLERATSCRSRTHRLCSLKGPAGGLVNRLARQLWCVVVSLSAPRDVCGHEQDKEEADRWVGCMAERRWVRELEELLEMRTAGLPWSQSFEMRTAWISCSTPEAHAQVFNNVDKIIYQIRSRAL